jgi:hypothetical protein
MDHCSGRWRMRGPFVGPSLFGGSTAERVKSTAPVRLSDGLPG